MLKFRKLIGLLVGLSLAVGLLGAGLNAAFSLTGSVSQTITVNGVAIAVSSTTPGATVDPITGAVTCPPVLINETGSPSGTDVVGCQFSIAPAAGVAPSSVDIHVSSNVAGGNKFTISRTDLGGYWELQTTPLLLEHSTTFPTNVQSYASWGTASHGGTGTPLDASDVGRSLIVTFAIAATP